MAPSGFDYSKWDKLELSDDEDDHPGAKMRQQLCAHIDAHAAVSHRHDYCTAKCRRRPRECRKAGIDPHS